MTVLIDIDLEKLLDNLEELCETPGPTQACVKVSMSDPRLNGEYPMQNKICEIVDKMRTEDGGDLDMNVIPHMGNLIVVGGAGRIHTPPTQKEIQRIKSIPVLFGAHLDEITYIVSRELSEDEKQDIRPLQGDFWRVMPICNPPKVLKYKVLKDNTVIYERNKPDEPSSTIDGLVGEIFWSDAEIVGFRARTFKRKIGKGILYKVYRLREGLKLFEEQEEVIVTRHEKEERRIDRKEFFGNEDSLERYFQADTYMLLRAESQYDTIREGDCVVQGTDMLERRDDVLVSKALDDRVGCIATLYAVRVLAKVGIPAKAILTSSEEGVPVDVSWGRLARASYKEFCNDDVVSLVCDGMNGYDLSTIVHHTKGNSNTEYLKTRGKELEEAVVIPYTANGKGGGDAGLFSILRDEVIPEINNLYGREVAVTSTEYSGRSYEVRIMDRWTQIGFVQWTSGIPTVKDCICHNKESVNIRQVLNIIRTLAHAAVNFGHLPAGKTNDHHFRIRSTIEG